MFETSDILDLDLLQVHYMSAYLKEDLKYQLNFKYT